MCTHALVSQCSELHFLIFFLVFFSSLASFCSCWRWLGARLRFVVRHCVAKMKTWGGEGQCRCSLFAKNRIRTACPLQCMHLHRFYSQILVRLHSECYMLLNTIKSITVFRLNFRPGMVIWVNCSFQCLYANFRCVILLQRIHEHWLPLLLLLKKH